jgi:hypothetical protein
MVAGLFLASAVSVGIPGIDEPAGRQHPADDSEASRHISMEFAAPRLSEKQGYLNVNVDGCRLTRSPGRPILPYAARTLTFPLGTRISDVQVSTGDVATMELQGTPMPAPHPISRDGDLSSEVHEGPVYRGSEPFPSDWIRWRTNGGLKNGEHVTFFTLNVYPVRYHPADGVIEYIRSVDVTVEYEAGEGLETGDSADMVVISPLTFYPAVTRLIEHKEKLGITCRWATPWQISSGRYFPAEGDDAAEQIKYFIKNAVEQWGTRYVLIMGAPGRVPMRTVYTQPAADASETFTSDLYYEDIYDGSGSFVSWDSNDNGFYGEYNHSGNIDQMDLYPDVHVGRLACRSLVEAWLTVDKIIAYESGAAGDWYKRFLVAGGDSFNDMPQWGTDYYEGEITVNASVGYMEGFTPVKLLGSNGGLTTENIKDEWSQGAGFVNLEGHGNYLSWATHPPHDYNTWIGIQVQDIPDLRNNGKLPFVVLGGCHIADMGHTYECFAWQLVRAPGKGAIATTGFTSLSWGADDDVNGNGKPDIIEYASGYLDILVFKQYGQNDITVAGEMCNAAVTEYLNMSPVEWNNAYLDIWDCKTVSAWVLLGDPSLQLGGTS